MTETQGNGAAPEETRQITDIEITESSDIYTGLERVQAIIDRKIVVPFHDLLGIDFKEAADGFLRVEVKPAHKHLGSGTAIHGGVFATMLDAAGGYAHYTTLPAGRWCVMGNLTIYFRDKGSVGDGPLVVEAHVIDRQRSTGLVDVKVSQNGVLKAHATAQVITISRQP